MLPPSDHTAPTEQMATIRQAKSQPPLLAEPRAVVETFAIHLGLYPHHFEDSSARLEPTYIEKGEDSLELVAPTPLILTLHNLPDCATDPRRCWSTE